MHVHLNIKIVSIYIYIYIYTWTSNSITLLYHDVKTRVEPGYNDIGLCHTPSITSDILWYQFLTANHNIILHSFVTHTEYPVPFMML